MAQQSQIAHRVRKMRSNRPKRQPTRQARHPGTRAPHGRKAKRRRAGRRSATKPHNLHNRKQRGEKGSRRDSHPDPYHQSNVHTKPRGGERPSAPQRGHDSTPQTSGRSHCFKLRDQATTSIQLSKVPPAGVEPATHSLRVNCSNQLSYGGFIFARFRRDSNPQPPAPEAGALSIELRKQTCDMKLFCAPSRSRTRDPPIKSRLL